MSTTVVFHIYINGKDVSIKTTTQEAQDGSNPCNSDEKREQEPCGYHGGGKKPPYFCSPLYYSDRIQDGNNESDPGTP